MTILYWHIGKRIRQDIIQSKRAEYGEEVIKSLAKELTAEYGKGFSRVAIIRMVQFYDNFPELEISSTLSNQLTWSHIIELLPLEDKKKQEFYAFIAIEEHWSVRQLRSNINRMTFERTLSNQQARSLNLMAFEQQKSHLIPELVLKDPYILDFLGLPDDHYESELEEAILKELEKFILELGTGFSFIARQKRITIDEDHFYLDLLLYNRKLKRLVAIELKTGKFKAEYKGQMELYLRYLAKYESFADELPPIGIILCTEKSQNQIELLDLNASGIHVAEYWTELPPKEIFEKKVQEIVLRSRQRLENHIK
jgi:predicted nuclease of restriction endonuclease-like (RecB) superfamily